MKLDDLIAKVAETTYVVHDAGVVSHENCAEIVRSTVVSMGLAVDRSGEIYNPASSTWRPPPGSNSNYGRGRGGKGRR